MERQGAAFARKTPVRPSGRRSGWQPRADDVSAYARNPRLKSARRADRIVKITGGGQCCISLVITGVALSAARFFCWQEGRDET